MDGIQRTVEFEDNRVSVVRYHFEPHAKTPMHEAPELVAIWLTDARLGLTFPDGTTKVESHEAGETAWAPAQQHAGENLAYKPLEFVSIQFKTHIG